RGARHVEGNLLVQPRAPKPLSPPGGEGQGVRGETISEGVARSPNGPDPLAPNGPDPLAPNGPDPPARVHRRGRRGTGINPASPGRHRPSPAMTVILTLSGSLSTRGGGTRRRSSFVIVELSTGTRLSFSLKRRSAFGSGRGASWAEAGADAARASASAPITVP